MTLFSMKLIGRKARNTFRKNKPASMLTDIDIVRESSVDAVATSIIEHEEVKAPLDVVAVTKDEQPIAADDHDDSENDLELDDHDDRFASELAEFESRLMSMQVPEDTLEEDFDQDEILNVRSEIEDDAREQTKLRLWLRVEGKMLLEDVRYYIAAAAEGDIDLSELLASTEDDSSMSEIEAFEATSMNMDVPSHHFEEEFDEHEDFNVQSEIESDIEHVTMLEEQLCVDVMLHMKEIGS